MEKLFLRMQKFLRKFVDKVPSLCGVLRCRLTTSAVTRENPSRKFPILFNFATKSLESQMYDYFFVFKAFTYYQEALMEFSAGAPQLGIVDSPGAL